MAKDPKRKSKPASLPRKAKGATKQPVTKKSARKQLTWNVGYDPAKQLEAAQMSPAGGQARAPQKPGEQSGPEVLDRLWAMIDSRKGVDPAMSHSARLLARGAQRIAQKLGEEATECVIEIVGGTRDGLIGESADLLYHLLVAWVHAGLRPEEMWHELHRRESVSRRSQAPGREGAIRRLLGGAQIKTTKIP